MIFKFIQNINFVFNGYYLIIAIKIMSISKKNLDKLKSFIIKQNDSNDDFRNLQNKKPSPSKNKLNPLSHNESSKIFYSIIDNAENLQETTLENKRLKEIEKESSRVLDNNLNLIDPPPFRNNHNHVLSEEEILYDEFNYLLDD